MIQTLLIAAALLLSASVCVAAESKAAAQTEAAGTPKAAEKGAKAKKPVTPDNPVDINSASKAQLKKIPGVNDAVADKIIAGRPYLSKAHLVTRNVISGVHYAQIKDLIIARQK
ncbi:MAG TPA: helix-hairpin-helix domain-containing protein [Burkholderiales bacterium]